MIVIIDYGLGNLGSVSNALTLLNIPHIISNKKEDILSASKLILPGVGAFGEGIKNLKELNLIDVLTYEVLVKKKKILGICLGMQLFCKKSYEEGEFLGLNFIDAEVIRFEETKEIRVPHVGWNDVICDLDSALLKGGRKIQTFYFVHSFYVNLKNKDEIIGICNHGIEFPAIIQKDNIFGVQFHPEKSQTEGLEILRKFANI
jgi:imidazole glycerol-phosphate synthase subunit HisH